MCVGLTIESNSSEQANVVKTEEEKKVAIGKSRWDRICSGAAEERRKRREKAA